VKDFIRNGCQGPGVRKKAVEVYQADRNVDTILNHNYAVKFMQRKKPFYF
jgi:hypothetical protein